MAGLENTLARIPGLAGYLGTEEFTQNQNAGQLSNAQRAMTLQDHFLAQQQTQAMRNALSQSSGDADSAMGALLRTGNVQAAAQLAPVAKLESERKLREETQRGMKDLISLDSATGQPSDQDKDRRRQRLNTMLGLYAHNPAVAARIQSEIDKMDTIKPMIEMNFPVGDNQVQPHISNDNGRTWTPMPGSQPSAKFAKQVAPVVNQEAPVTPVTIANPEDPSKTIIVDGRTGKKIGDGPKLTAVGNTDLDLAKKKPEATQRVDLIKQNYDRLTSAMEELANDPGLSHITGPIYGRVGNITPSATGAQGRLNSIKSQIFQNSLTALRAASKTGGAVGNVSDREGDKLERTLASLDQAMGTPDFKRELRKAIQQVKDSKEIIDNAYKEQFGNVQSYQPGGAAPRKKVSEMTNAELEARRKELEGNGK